MQKYGQESFFHLCGGASLVAQTVKNLPTVQETQVRSLSQKDPLKKEMVFLSGKSHGQSSLLGYSPGGHKESDTPERLILSIPFKWSA